MSDQTFYAIWDEGSSRHDDDDALVAIFTTARAAGDWLTRYAPDASDLFISEVQQGDLIDTVGIWPVADIVTDADAGRIVCTPDRFDIETPDYTGTDIEDLAAWFAVINSQGMPDAPAGSHDDPREVLTCLLQMVAIRQELARRVINAPDYEGLTAGVPFVVLRGVDALIAEHL